MKLLFYPDYPRKTEAWQDMFPLANIEIVTDPTADYDRVMLWSYTKSHIADPEVLAMVDKLKPINHGCVDIRKSKVERIMLDVFGYNSLIDPDNLPDCFVKKCESQSSHKIHSLVSDYIPEEGFIYCKLLADPIDEETLLYHRVWLFGKNIPVSLDVHVPKSQRFGGIMASKTFMKLGCPRLTTAEKEKLFGFCDRFGVHIAELDIQWDIDGKLYILDVNNVPGGKIFLTNGVYEEGFVEIWADAFNEFLEAWV